MFTPGPNSRWHFLVRTTRDGQRVCRSLDTEKNTRKKRWVAGGNTQTIFGNKIIVLYANRQLLLGLTVWRCRTKVVWWGARWPLKSTASACCCVWPVQIFKRVLRWLWRNINFECSSTLNIENELLVYWQVQVAWWILIDLCLTAALHIIRFVSWTRAVKIRVTSSPQ